MRLRLPIHGRDHRPGGGDPITWFISYVWRNVGKWLDIETTDGDPDNFYGFHLNNTGTGLVVLESNGGGDFRIYQNNGFLDIQGGHVAITSNNTGDRFDMYAAGGYAVRFATAKSITFYKGTGSTDPIMRLDADGELHMLTGASITADL